MRQVVTIRRWGIGKFPAAPGNGGSVVPDSYTDRLVKYVPVETIIVWITVFGSTSAVAYNTEFFPLFARWALVLGAAGTWIYLRYWAEVQDYVQLACSAIGFVVWVHAFAVLPFAAFPWYNPIAGAILLPLYTALVPLVDGIPGRPGRS
jgi:hypothetical protein